MSETTIQRDHDGHKRATDGSCTLCGANAKEVFGTVCGWPRFQSETVMRAAEAVAEPETVPAQGARRCPDCGLEDHASNCRHRLRRQALDSLAAAEMAEGIYDRAPAQEATPETPVPYSKADACWCQPFDGPRHPECPMHSAAAQGAAADARNGYLGLHKLAESAAAAERFEAKGLNDAALLIDGLLEEMKRKGANAIDESGLTSIANHLRALATVRSRPSATKEAQP